MESIVITSQSVSGLSIISLSLASLLPSRPARESFDSANDEGSPLPGGIGDIDYWKASYWEDFVGVTVRTYDSKTGLWRIYWVDNIFSGGVIQPPVVGKFDGNVGMFEGPDTFNGIRIIVRYTWTVNRKGSKVVAKWEQAFSTNNGKTWETNWYNEFIHDDNCTPMP